MGSSIQAPREPSRARRAQGGERSRQASRQGADCAPKQALAARRLIGPRQASEVAELFKVLANDTRLRILHALVRHGERCVGDLADDVGGSLQAVSNQLARLTDGGIVSARRDGTFIHYRIIDPCVSLLLERGLCLVEDLE